MEKVKIQKKNHDPDQHQNKKNNQINQKNKNLKEIKKIRENHNQVIILHLQKAQKNIKKQNHLRRFLLLAVKVLGNLKELLIQI